MSGGTISLCLKQRTRPPSHSNVFFCIFLLCIHTSDSARIPSLSKLPLKENTHTGRTHTKNKINKDHSYPNSSPNPRQLVLSPCQEKAACGDRCGTTHYSTHSSTAQTSAEPPGTTCSTLQVALQHRQFLALRPRREEDGGPISFFRSKNAGQRSMYPYSSEVLHFGGLTCASQSG